MVVAKLGVLIPSEPLKTLSSTVLVEFLSSVTSFSSVMSLKPVMLVSTSAIDCSEVIFISVGVSLVALFIVVERSATQNGRLAAEFAFVLLALNSTKKKMHK